MNRANDDLFVPTIQSSILIIIFKEGSFEFMMKIMAEGDIFISMGILFQHLAPE